MGYINLLGEHGKGWFVFDPQKCTYSELEQVKISLDDIHEICRKGFLYRKLWISTKDVREFEFTDNVGEMAELLDIESKARGRNNITG